jgi:putative transposase
MRDYGYSTLSVGRVYRLMKSMALPKMSTVKPKFQLQPSQPSFPCPNHLQQRFNPQAPNQVWLSDISYIPLRRGHVYLCVIIDAFSRQVISWNVYSTMTSQLVFDTLVSAISKRDPSPFLMFHSDRGSQYLSNQVRQVLDTHQLIPSYSKPSYPWDNAVTESFFKSMKKEELNRRTFTSLKQVYLSCFEYIEGFYNSKRPHLSLDMLTPNEKERLFYEHH